jgi:hypothetical protein
MTPFRCCGERYWLDASYDDRGEYVTDVCTDDGAPADHCAVCGRSFEDEEVS